MYCFVLIKKEIGNVETYLIQIEYRTFADSSSYSRLPNVMLVACPTRQTTAFATVRRQRAAFSAGKQRARQTIRCCWSKRISSFSKRRHRLIFTFSSCRASCIDLFSSRLQELKGIARTQSPLTEIIRPSYPHLG